jgi:hypothetical protein
MCGRADIRYAAVMIGYRILLTVDAIVAAALLYFFFAGLEDGSVSSFNIPLWLGLLGGAAAIIVGAYVLKSKGRLLPANLLLLIPAFPGFMFGLFILAAILLHPRWN